jgi:KEOPS complex subunit Cgi121
VHLQKVVIGPSTHVVGLFGIALESPLPPKSLFDRLKPVTKITKVTLQLVNADYIISPDHLLFATIHALTAFHRGTNRASTLSTEILRFVAAQRQISKALDIIGLNDKTERIGGVLVHPSPQPLRQVYQEFLRLVPCTETPTVLEVASTKKLAGILDLFQITELELEAIAASTSFSDRQLAAQKLVYDRCALLAISH